MRTSRSTAAAVRLLCLSLLLLGVVGCTAPAAENATITRQQDPGGYRGGASLPEPVPMPDATLTDSSGRAYSLSRTPSKPVTLLFFGYTHCPDVCLGVLSDVATALARMPTAARDQIQLVFITTDPARDDEAAIAKYLNRFDPTFIGLTGQLSTIKSVAEQVGVDIQGKNELPSGGYEVGHSAQVIGFDKEHQGVVMWTPSTAIGDLADDLELLVAKQQ